MTLTETAHDPTPSTTAWWALADDDAVERLGTDRADGLTGDDAAERLTRYGPNELSTPPPRPMWLRFVDQFRSLLVGLLALGAAAAAAVGDLKDAIVIASVLVINAVLGVMQEARAERSLDALRAMLTATARVKRDGRTIHVEAAELVPGDVVLLEAGDRVPADARILVSIDGEADESSLTGESLAVPKASDSLAEPDAPLGDRASMVWMNTTVTRGRVEAVVVATGMSTEMGRIAELINTAADTETPLARQLDGLGKRLAGVAGVAMVTYLGVGLARGDELKDIIGSAIGLAVAAVPEGLPAVVTVTLALGVHAVAKRGAIVKNLASVETLGSTSVICSDKTGTLTLNRMTAVEVQMDGRRHELAEPSMGGFDPASPHGAALVDVMVLASDAVVERGGLEIGDPTEVGLVRVAADAGVDVAAERRARPRAAEVPFDSARKYMASFTKPATVGGTAGSNGAATMLDVSVKGAADRLIERCSTVLTAEGPVPLDDERIAAIEADMHAAARMGRRMLAMCRTTVDAAAVAGKDQEELVALLGDLELVGLVGLTDPPRPEAEEAIRVAQGAGMRVKMITGDHPETAAAIAAELGIVGDTVAGAELDGWSDERLDERVEDVGVFARVSPEHKLRIVRALQHRGHVTAMTGDGVNDAPSLKQADVGVAMGITGTEVSKEAADVVLADDQLSSIVAAVGQGRAVYDNIVTFVRFQVATNVGAIVTLVGSQLIGLTRPFAAIQLLWINIIMDGPPAMALGTDKPRPNVMDRPPRPRGVSILDAHRLRILLLQGSLMAAISLGILAWASDAYDEPIAATMAFTTFVLLQIVNAMNVRSRRTVFARSTFTNRWLWIALATVSVLQVCVIEIEPLRDLFEVRNLDLEQWAICVAGALTLGVIDEIRRQVTFRDEPVESDEPPPLLAD